MMNFCVIAYLDPGTGSMVLQFLVGGILGSVLIIKIFWRRLVSFFTGKKYPTETSAEDRDDKPVE